jgi:hypothetical protein
MERRAFLIRTAAVVGLAGTHRRTGASAQSAEAAKRARLARVAMMTLNFTTLLKTPGQPESPDRTLDLFDLPAMYADTYGVHNIELQHYHVASTEPSYIKELRSRIDRAKSKTTQVVVEFGALNISAPDHNFLPRLQAIDLTKVWIDRAAALACPRIMVNQGQPTPENRAHAVDTLKAMVAYGASKGVTVTMETRGGGEPAWRPLNELARSGGGFINIDLGGVGATSQEELHAALKELLPSTSGSMHVSVRQNAAWDLASALKFIESQGYKGLYSIEARGHDATRAIYNTILETI